MDEYRGNDGVTEFEALKLWNQHSDFVKEMWLTTAYCMKCKATTILPGFNLSMSHNRILIEGQCATCGGRASRTCD
ncbi:hypothetical protein HZY88_06785 [Aerococcaceae bacterium DSM 111176]|nr:hypothetical protein [Aerococcaceae bacterium DSM 111176]